MHIYIYIYIYTYIYIYIYTGPHLNTVRCSENGVRCSVLCSVTELFSSGLNEVFRPWPNCPSWFVMLCVRVGGPHVVFGVMFGRVLFDVLFVGAWARMFCSALCSKRWLCSAGGDIPCVLKIFHAF